MSFLSKYVIRGLLLGSLAAYSCTSDGDQLPAPGSISLALSEASATVEQGGSQSLTATLTRSGGFTGTVNLTVTGAASGVTATVSNVQTAGVVTTATVTIFAGLAVPAVYPLVVHATGSGVTEVTQAFTLTVPVGLGFSISLSESALSIEQGASTPTTMVNITRSSHAGGVGLYVTGLPAGVTASFAPDDWPVGSSTMLALTVAAAALPGLYTLQVNAYDPEQDGEVSAPLALTITAPAGYALSLTAAALSVAQGSSSTLNTLYLDRTRFIGDVTLSVDNVPPGVTAYFYPANPTSAGLSGLYLFVAGTALPGTYTNLLVRGVASGLTDRTAPLSLTITVAPFALTLSSSTLGIAQGAATPTTTVNVLRDNFSGPVTLYIDTDGHGGILPPGVTAAFGPNPVTGNSSVLTLSVGTAAVPGVYELWVYGEASTGWFNAIPLTLTVTAPSAPAYTLSLSAPALSIVRGGATKTTTVHLVRTDFTGPVTLYVDEDFHLGSPPPGMTAAFGPNPATGNSSVLTITVGAAAVPGVYELYVYGHASTGWSNAIPLTVTVLAASP